MPIHDDVRAGNVEAVARQLDAGVEVDTVPENATDEFPALTPLMWAVVSEKAGVEMVRLLLERGADANAIARNTIYQGNDKTVLSLAICHGDKSKIELLLEAGADITYRCGWSDAIFDAIDSLSWMPENDFKAGRKIRELLEFLVARGAPSQGADCVESALVWAFDQHDYDLLRFLANIGCSFDWPQWTPFMQVLMMGTGQDLERALSNASRADLEARDWMNRTPFLLCVYMGDIEKACLLLSAGSLLNDHGHCGQPTLMSAIEGNQVEMLSWLIDQGADIHARDEFRKTPLMAAVSHGETECARILLEVGARVDATDASGETQREQLTRFAQENWTGTDVYQMILDSGRSYLDDVVAGQTVIAMAWEPEIVRMLLKAGASLDDVSEEMRAALVGLPAETEIRCTGEE